MKTFKIGDKILFCNLYHEATAKFYGIYTPEYVTVIDDTPIGLLLVEFDIPSGKMYGYMASKYRFYINPNMLQPMKSPEQKITDLEKRQEEITKEITELKKELNPKERTLFQIRQDWQNTSSNVIVKRARERKVQAICDMMAVADELNGDWKPDWKDGQQNKYYLNMDCGNFWGVSFCRFTGSSFCFFKTEELAQKAIQILGEEKIKLALS